MHEVRKICFDIELVLVFESMHLLSCERHVSMHEVRKLRARGTVSIDVAMEMFYISYKLEISISISDNGL